MTTKIAERNSTMPWEETLALLDAADIELEKGNEDAAFALIQKVPLMPELALCFATQAGLGPEVLKTSGFNLADAERKYGRDWLERL